MDDSERAKEFAKKWARYSSILAGVYPHVSNDLKSEPGPLQQAQAIFSDEMGDSEARRKIAFHLALADFQAMSQQR